MRWTRVALLTRAHPCGRRSRVVLTPRRWCQASRKYPRGDGGKQARSPGRARNKPLTPSRAGMLGDPGATVVTNACAYYTSRTRLRVHRAPGIPRALCWAEINAKLGRYTPREYRRPSSPAKAGDPVFRSVSDRTQKLPRTGYSAGACHRARRRRDPVAEYDGFM
jgi:hypothetical protein